MKPHDSRMLLNGTEVRHRAAELAPADPDLTADGARYAQRHFMWLSEQSGIPVGTLHNATRDHRPQGIVLSRVYDVAAIVRDEDKPDEQKPEPSPPKERPRDPSSPPPRKNGKDNQRGPKRTAELRAAS